MEAREASSKIISPLERQGQNFLITTTAILSTILSDQSEPLTIKSRGPVLAINFFITHKVRVSSPASLCSKENSILNNSRNLNIFPNKYNKKFIIFVWDDSKKEGIGYYTRSSL